MNENDKTGIAVIVILVFIILAPIALILFTFQSEPYHVVGGEPVREAAQAVGVRVVNTSEVAWALPGSMGGKSYVLEDDDANTVIIQTQKFDGPASRDVAILTFSAQSTGKGKTIGTLIVIGDHLIHISPDRGGILQRIAPELQKKRVSL